MAVVLASTDIATARQCESTKLVGEISSTSHSLGYSAAIEGDLAIIGDGTGPNVPGSGAGHLFKRDATGAWAKVALLIPSTPMPLDHFGTSSAISGNTIVMGARFSDIPCGGVEFCSAGMAFVFQQSNKGSWAEVAALAANDAQAGDVFGRDVAISGDTVVVGSEAHDEDGWQAGSAYIFMRDIGGPNTWGQLVELHAADASADKGFGYSVAIDGDVIVIGAPGDDTNSMNSGAVYVFYRNHGGLNNWGQVKKLKASDPAMADEFGASVDISGDTVLVGAPFDDDACINNPACNSGSAYIFQRDQDGADNWGLVKKILPSDLSSGGDHFARSVALDGDIAIIGAYVYGPSSGPAGWGAAFVFQRDSGGPENWGESARILASDRQLNDYFGWEVSISGNTGVVTAWKTNSDCKEESCPQAGSAYIFTALESADCNCNGVPDAQDIADGASVDCDSNGTLDECDIQLGNSCDQNLNGVLDRCEGHCLGNVNCDGVVDVDDLLSVIDVWGANSGLYFPQADLSGDGLRVDVDDLLIVINGWGPCS